MVKKIEKELEELWQKAVIKKWGGKCSICGSNPPLDIHHFVHRRRSNNLKYDVMNGIPLCRRCHFNLHHDQEAIMAILIVKKRGDKWWEYIEKQKNIMVRKNKAWFEDTMQCLKK